MGETLNWDIENLSKFFKDKKELHLISLGQGGGIYEMTDGTYFSVKVCGDNKVLIKGLDGEYSKTSNVLSLQSLVEFLQREMFIDILKLKRKYGSFEFDGELIYAPQYYYDDDDTVTLIATKYHKVRLGFQGAVVIRNFNTTNDISEIDKEDALKTLQVYFTIFSHLGFKCYLNEETIPSDEVDVCIEIPKNYVPIEIPSILNLLAINHKSFINAKIDIDGCEVRGYTFFVKGKPHKIINKRWEELRQKHLEKYFGISEMFDEYFQSENITKEEIEKWIDKCLDFFHDDKIPKGVRMEKYNPLYDKLGELCKKHNISLGDYLRLFNKFLTIQKN